MKHYHSVVIFFICLSYLFPAYSSNIELNKPEKNQIEFQNFFLERIINAINRWVTISQIEGDEKCLSHDKKNIDNWKKEEEILLSSLETKQSIAQYDIKRHKKPLNMQLKEIEESIKNKKAFIKQLQNTSEKLGEDIQNFRDIYDFIVSKYGKNPLLNVTEELESIYGSNWKKKPFGTHQRPILHCFAYSNVNPCFLEVIIKSFGDDNIINVPSHDGFYPLDFAVLVNNQGVISVLRKYNARLSPRFKTICCYINLLKKTHPLVYTHLHPFYKWLVLTPITKVLQTIFSNPQEFGNLDKALKQYYTILCTTFPSYVPKFTLKKIDNNLQTTPKTDE